MVSSEGISCHSVCLYDYSDTGVVEDERWIEIQIMIRMRTELLLTDTVLYVTDASAIITYCAVKRLSLLLNHCTTRQLSKRQCFGHSGIFSFYVKTNDKETVSSFLQKLKMFTLATSLGGPESLCVHS